MPELGLNIDCCLPILYPSYHFFISSMLILYLVHRTFTSSSVKPKSPESLPGTIIEYSVKLLRADSVLYFFIGKMPVRYTPAKTLAAFTSLNIPLNHEI